MDFPENVCLQLKSSQKALLKKDLDVVDWLVDGCLALFCCILCNLLLPMQDWFWKASRRKCVGVFPFLFGSMRAEI